MADRECNRGCLPRGFIDQRARQEIGTLPHARSNNCTNKAEDDCGQMTIFPLVTGRGVNCQPDSGSGAGPDRGSGKLRQDSARQSD